MKFIYKKSRSHLYKIFFYKIHFISNVIDFSLLAFYIQHFSVLFFVNISVMYNLIAFLKNNKWILTLADKGVRLELNLVLDILY